MLTRDQILDESEPSQADAGGYLQSIDYRYTIRGWLKSINNDPLTNDPLTNNTNDDSNDLFGMQLNYEQAVAVNGVNTDKQFNGNISSMQWSSNNLRDPAKQKVYGFGYDQLNRLSLGGNFGVFGASSSNSDSETSKKKSVDADKEAAKKFGGW